MARQPHTEETIRHTDDQQDTGNHKVDGAPDADGADRFGGSRAGAGNVEHAAGRPGGTGSVERAGDANPGSEDVERVAENGEEGHLRGQ